MCVCVCVCEYEISSSKGTTEMFVVNELRCMRFILTEVKRRDFDGKLSLYKRFGRKIRFVGALCQRVRRKTIRLREKRGFVVHFFLSAQRPKNGFGVKEFLLLYYSGLFIYLSFFFVHNLRTLVLQSFAPACVNVNAYFP